MQISVIHQIINQKNLGIDAIDNYNIHNYMYKFNMSLKYNHNMIK